MFASFVHPSSVVVSHEVSAGQLSLCRVEGDRIIPLAGGLTGGDDPTHIAVVHSTPGTVVLAANYTSGSLSMNVLKDDLLGPTPELIISYIGSGPVAGRQDSSHPHQVVVDSLSGSVLVPDLGADSIHVHRMTDLAAGKPIHRDLQLPPGCGPRHLVITDGIVIVACELDNTVRTIDLDSGTQLDCAPASKSLSEGICYPSAIRLTRDGQVLVANRGPDTLGVLAFDGASGTLRYVAEYPCGGEHPRDFELTGDERHVVVANLSGNRVSILERDSSGQIQLTSNLPIPSPTCTVRFPQ